MGLYRQTMQWPAELEELEKQKNPSTLADLKATAAILEKIYSNLSQIASRLGSGLIYLGEETEYLPWLKNHLDSRIFYRIQHPNNFFIDQDNVIRVIFDGIDGTKSFLRGIPIFCSAVAILIGTQPRVSAIYDPVYHVVYSALLSGTFSDPVSRAQAYAWEVASGSKTNLIEIARNAESTTESQEVIGIHLTRTKKERLGDFLEAKYIALLYDLWIKYFRQCQYL